MNWNKRFADPLRWDRISNVDGDMGPDLGLKESGG